MYEIVIGRSKQDVEKLGLRGTIFVGREYVNMGNVTSLSNDVYMDISTSHVVFICGKRGSGKSYTMGVIAEGLADIEKDIRQNLSIIMMDPMGVYWTMKNPNKKDAKLLKSWNVTPHGLDVLMYVPYGFEEEYKKKIYLVMLLLQLILLNLQHQIGQLLLKLV